MSSVHFLIGKTLGKYEVLEHIGHGGMSEVYKGQQAQLDRMVAIKVLHPFLADDQGFVVRFQREARIVATMRHPNIVQVYDFDYNDPLSLYYMVMEYIEGPTLKDRLQNGPLSSEQVVHIGAAIADALDYAHQRAMVHRDIKPANIMFVSEAEPVLTDFGIARMLTLSGLTASGAMVGTPAYMAPEIGRGKSGTASSDIYSLSVVLYEAVTGELPFSAESPMGMVMEHINTPPPLPQLVVPSIPTPLQDVIMRGLEKEPEDRFGSAGEMSDALRRALGIEASPFARPLSSVIPRTDSPPPPTQSPRGETPVPGVAEPDRPAPEKLTQAPAADEAEETPPDSHPDVDTIAGEAAEPARPSLRRRLGWLRAGLLLLLMLIAGSGIWFVSNGKDLPSMIRFRSPDVVAATSAPPSTPTSAPTASPSPTAIALAAPLDEPLPTPTPTQACTLRVHQDRVRIEPDPIVAPGTSLMAYVSLDNSGTCAWPDNTALTFTSGDQLGAPGVFTVTTLAPGDAVQMLIPMTAPEETGVYSSTWELRRQDGRALGSRILLEITVDDIATLTPTPTPDVALDVATPAPLVVETVELVDWHDDPASGRWSGVAKVQASGGTGTYRYYQDEVSNSTQLPAGELSFEWRRCQPLPLEIWVLSGDEVLDWQGEIPYPDPDACK